MYHLKQGLFIALEGIDGCGKTTLSNFLYNELSKQGYTVILTKEPGGTPAGKMIRAIVQQNKLESKAEFLLFAADRAQHMHEVIRPALLEKKIVISDRTADSALAYQGYGRGLDRHMINVVNSWATDNIRPTITLYVNIDAETAFRRITARAEEKTIFEEEKLEFFNKVLAGFKDMYNNRHDVIQLDGTRTPEEIAEQALKPILEHIKTCL